MDYITTNGLVIEMNQKNTNVSEFLAYDNRMSAEMVRHGKEEREDD